MRYLQNLCTNQEFKAAYLGLNKRGLIRIENETFRMLKHFATDKKCLSRYACLSEDPRHIEFLIACYDCCGMAWDTGRKVSARSAVQWVIKARYEWTKPVFKKQVKQLIALGVIEKVASKGTTAFRLTVHATETLSPDYSRGFSDEWILGMIGVSGLPAQTGTAAGGVVFLVGVRGWLDFLCQEADTSSTIRRVLWITRAATLISRVRHLAG